MSIKEFMLDYSKQVDNTLRSLSPILLGGRMQCSTQPGHPQLCPWCYCKDYSHPQST